MEFDIAGSADSRAVSGGKDRGLPAGESFLSTTDTPVDLRSILDLSRDGILIVQDGTVIDVNQRMADMCGRPAADWRGHPLSALQDSIPGDVSRLAASVQPDHAPAVKDRRVELTHHNGRKVPVSISGGKIDLNGAAAVLFMVTNLTGTLKTEDELQKTRHLESIAALSGGIAHDYNNLLTVIIGNISLVQSYLDPADVIHRMLGEAHEASMVAKSLTQKLITFSKGGSPIKETADMAELLRIVTEFSLSGSNIESRFDIPNGMTLVDIDKTQISQAVHNLVMNARESMPKGGILTLTAENVQNIDGDESPAGGPWVKISIRDQGNGIPAEHLGKIYDPYFSTKERGNQKGTGLGLSICHSIVQRHEGFMKVESVVGQGTVAHIYLKASEHPDLVQAPASDSPCMTSAVPGTGSGRILVMDDEEMITKMAGRILARLGYETEFARNGEEAVDIYRRAMPSAAPFDAVILDLTVRGGMGGEEAVQHLRRIDPHVKAIVSSGYSDSPIMHNFTEYGFCGVVVKPYSLNEIGRELNRTLSLSTPARP